MYRSIRPTHLARAAASTPSVLVSRAPGSRRLASTASSASKRTWKGAAARWGLAGAALYWYNTSPIFAEDAIPTTKSESPLAAAAAAATTTDPSATGASSPVPEENFRTVDSLLEEKQKEASRRAAAEKKAADDKKAAEAPAEGSPEALEAEAGQQGAFNPETGEINWDCPCLGGMAHGPCGEDFKAAFSCFVFSTEEPKGMDCIEKFQHMQDCFRKYPEIYGSELQDDEEEGAEGTAPAAPASGDVTDDKPANGAPTKAQIAEKLAENKEAKKEESKKEEAKTGAPTSTPPADIKDDIVQAEVTEDKPKADKKKKAKKAKKTEKTESVPTAATDATDATPAPAAAEPAAPAPAPAAPAPTPVAAAAAPAADDGVPKAAFDATSANQ